MESGLRRWSILQRSRNCKLAGGKRMHLIQTDGFETVKRKYNDVIENTPDIEKYARCVYGKHPTDESLKEYIDRGEMYVLMDGEEIAGMYIVKAEADQVEKIVDMSVRAFETDVNVGGVKGECPPEFDSVEWHKQMAREGHLYQAMIGKDLVGAAIIFPDETKNSVYIGRIFIDSIYHRKGYGIRLMECIVKYFPCAAEFHPDTPCRNQRTNAFYKRLGYRIIKVEDEFFFYHKRKSEPSVIQNVT